MFGPTSTCLVIKEVEGVLNIEQFVELEAQVYPFAEQARGKGDEDYRIDTTNRNRV